MKEPQPIVVIDLFPEVLDALVSLLSTLSDEEWARPTVAPGWTVKDVALHLLGGDIGMLSRGRDGFSLPAPSLDEWDALVAFINQLNATWMEGARRISPRLLCDLLRWTGEQVNDYFRTLDPNSMGGAVSWAGPQAAPIWLDLAREYTERWHHQQQIRDAVGRPGLLEPRYFASVLDAFVRALPPTFRDVEAAEGTLVALTIAGNAGGRWGLLRESGQWRLYAEMTKEADAEAILPQDAAWRLFSKGMTSAEARAHATFRGDLSFAEKLLDTVSVIA